MPPKEKILSKITFGERVAEEEIDELGLYFVETDQWKRVFDGDVDIIYGAKGFGKSAIYSLILNRAGELAARGINVIPAENPSGAPVFGQLVADPPNSENELRGLWKIYFLSLIAETFRKASKLPEPCKRVLEAMQEAGLVARDSSLPGKLKSAMDYVRRHLKAEAVEGGIKIDSTTGMPTGVTGRIILREPNSLEHEAGLVSADNLLKLSHEGLKSEGRRIWLVLDRLDVAFVESPELESNALRALFRVYLDLVPFECICLKIFLRSDIWKRIMTKPFPEASHITRTTTISWNKNSLLNLVARRLLHNAAIVEFYKVKPEIVLDSLFEQLQFFYKVYPAQVDAGPNKPKTLDWMLSRTSDGSRETAPRELIHLLSSVRDSQLKSLEIGGAEPEGEALFDRNAIKDSLSPVSKARFEQTLCAEYPQFKGMLKKLENEKTEQRPATLAKIWDTSIEEALKLAEQLTEIGFFERQGTKEDPVFKVPFLYRGALSMVQGSAK